MNNWLTFVFLFGSLLLMSSTESQEQTNIKYTNKTNFDIFYNLPKENNSSANMDLWLTEDGGNNWKNIGSDIEKRGFFTYTANKDGVYGFLTIINTVENKASSTPAKGALPQWVYILDRKKPEINLESQKKLVYRPESEVLLKWVCSDAHLGERPISISLSKDQGKSWQALQVNLKEEAPYSVRAPSEDKTEFQLKVTVMDLAGNESSAITETLFVDGTKPSAKVTGPAISKQKQFELQVLTNSTGKASVKGVNLWWSKNNGSDWQIYAHMLTPQKPISFLATSSNSYSFYATAVDSAGNEGSVPSENTIPQHTVILDDSKPIIEILEPKLFPIIGGEKRLNIKWVAKDDNLKAFPIAIYYSLDNGNKWELITKNEKPEDSFLWYVPKTDAQACSIKLTAIDEVGNIGEAILPFTFAIDSTPPISKAMYLKNQDIENKKKPDLSKVGQVDDQRYLQTSLEEVDSLKTDKQFELAMGLLQKLEAIYPNCARIFYEEALILSTYLPEESPQSMNQAIYLLEKAISLDANYEVAYILRGAIYYKKYGLEKNEQQKTHYLLLAEHEYLCAIQILGDNYEEYSNLGIIYFKLNRMEEAKKYLLKATFLQTKPAICFWYLAKIEELQENFKKSEHYWQKAAKAYGVNTPYGEKAVWNAESAKSKQIGKQILE